MSSDRTLLKPRPGGKLPANMPAPAPAPAAPAPIIPDFSTPAPAAMAQPVPGPAAVPGFVPSRFEWQDVSEFALVNLASPIFNFVETIHKIQNPESADLLHQESIELIKGFEQEAKRVGIDLERILATRYALCALVDESVMNSAWGSQSHWLQRGMLILFHKEVAAGEIFFQRLDQFLSAPNPDIDLLQIYYLCLSFGFKGKWRIEASGDIYLDNLRNSIYQKILINLPESRLKLSDKGMQPISKSNKFSDIIPLWVFAVFFATLVLAVYMSAEWSLGKQTDSVVSLLQPLSNGPAAIADLGPVVDGDQSIEKLLQSEIQHGVLQVSRKQHLVIITLPSENLFNSASANIESRVFPVMDKIALSIRNIEGQIKVTGYTDDRAIHTSEFPSNWHLSLARASAVVKYMRSVTDFKAVIIPEGMGAAKPKVANDSDQHRALNRRVEIELSLP